MLKNAKISCHHGHIQFENQLQPMINLIKNNNMDSKHSKKSVESHIFDIIEIDFVCYQNEYISSHDYILDNINKGSKLEDWVDLIIKYNKMLWIDLKDTTSSLFINTSQLNIPLLLQKLNLLKLKYLNLNQHILLGCQYQMGYQQLLSYQHDYTVLTDLPQDYAYVLNYLTPSLFKSTINDYIKTWIQNNTYNDILALDVSFFNNLDEVKTFIDSTTSSVVILYNFEKGYKLPLTFYNKQIIIQYNFN
jgi:hypothetical protein